MMHRIILTAFATASAVAHVPARAEAGDLLLKARATYHHRSDGFSFTLDQQAQAIDAKVDSAVGGEASGTLFLGRHVATEFSLGGARYDLEDAADGSVISAGLLLSTVTLQLHPLGDRSAVRPYAGAGLTYMNFYGEDLGAAFVDQSVGSPASYSSGISGGFAPVVQAGVDVAVNQRLYVNLDAKYASMKTEAYIDRGTRVTVARRMGSLIVAGGVGFRF